MAIIYAVPVPPSVAPAHKWPGLDMYWTGADGSHWSLVSVAHGSVMLPGVRGLSMPPVTHFKDKYASIPGSRWRGMNIEEREVFWPIQVFHDVSSQDWLDRDRAFWHSLHPATVGTWTVIQPSGEKRDLHCRFLNDGTGEFATDPSITGWTNYGITLVAESPFWEGKPVTSGPWRVGAGGQFFSSTPGDGFTISPGATASSAVMNNPGDEPAYLTWVLKGPITSATVGLNGQLITVPFTIPDGQELVIETHPAKQTAKLNGVDKIMDLTTRNFAQLPAGKDVPLSLSVTGTGSITAKFTPQYYRAW